MSFVRLIMTKPGTEPNEPREAPVRPAPRPPLTREPPPEETAEDADFGEEFGHSVKTGRVAGGEGFQHDEYDKVV